MGKLESIARNRGLILYDELFRLYVQEVKGCDTIAKIFCVTPATIRYHLRKMNIPIRHDFTGSNNPMYGKQFSLEERAQQSCRLKKVIADRGEHWSKGRIISDAERKKRSIAMTGQGNPRWKGGKRNKDGYIEIFAPDHPHCNKLRKTVYEHRLVMEKHLGRYLLTDEHVHHINGDKSDNEIENLLLLSISEHSKLHGSLKEQHHRTYLCTPETWHRTKFTCCQKCKTTTIRHRGHGLCAKCYMQEKRNKKLKFWKEGGINAN